MAVTHVFNQHLLLDVHRDGGWVFDMNDSVVDVANVNVLSGLVAYIRNVEETQIRFNRTSIAPIFVVIQLPHVW